MYSFTGRASQLSNKHTTTKHSTLAENESEIIGNTNNHAKNI